MNLIGQVGFKDAFDLDASDPDDLVSAFERKPRSLAAPRRGSQQQRKSARALGDHDDAGVEFFRHASMVKMRGLHHTMTNALRRFCKGRGLVIEEGLLPRCMFDARVREYDGDRHLLVEVKTDSKQPTCRLAVGQLFDYRRQLSDRGRTDLGGAPVPYGPYLKQPPVNHYYWVPPPHPVWPTMPSQFTNMYGSYFAYLLRRFRLKNAYFTNAIKCSLAPIGADQFLGASEYAPAVRNNCLSRYLLRELSVFRPRLVFAFGRSAYSLLTGSATLAGVLPSVFYLIHPGARMSKIGKIEQNKRLSKELSARLHSTESGLRKNSNSKIETQ